jgi:hypothetical protein
MAMIGRRRLDALGARIPPSNPPGRAIEERVAKFLTDAEKRVAEERARWNALYLAVVRDPKDRRDLEAVMAARERHPGNVCIPTLDTTFGRQWLDDVLDRGTNGPSERDVRRRGGE